MSPRWVVSFSLGRLGLGETSPVTWGFERAKNKGQGQIPLSQITTNQIVPAKQPIIRYNQRKGKHLLEITQQENLYVQSWLVLHINQ
jgi:hypothetical protein